MRLHIGGREPRPGWTLMNIQPGEGVDVVGDISDLSQFADESCDCVYASHVLEHIHQAAVAPTLRGIRRVLKPGARLYVSVPDLDTLCMLLLQPDLDLHVRWHIVRMMFGGQVDANDFHFVGFNQAILYDFLSGAGFASAQRVRSFGLFDDTSDYRPYGDLPISLNVIATR